MTADKNEDEIDKNVLIMSCSEFVWVDFNHREATLI